MFPLVPKLRLGILHKLLSTTERELYKTRNA